MTQKIKWAVKLGRLASGAQSDHGTVKHLVSWETGTNGAAICGTRPGRRSVGWQDADAPYRPCPHCLKRAERQGIDPLRKFN